MAQLAFIISLMLVAASGIVFVAGEVYGHGFSWADQICYGAGKVCENRYWLGCATAGAVAVYFVLRELEA